MAKNLTKNFDNRKNINSCIFFSKCTDNKVISNSNINHTIEHTKKLEFFEKNKSNDKNYIRQRKFKHVPTYIYKYSV